MVNARATCQLPRDLTSASQLMHRQGDARAAQEMGYSWGVPATWLGRLTVMLPWSGVQGASRRAVANMVRTGHI